MLHLGMEFLLYGMCLIVMLDRRAGVTCEKREGVHLVLYLHIFLYLSALYRKFVHIILYICNGIA